MKEKQTFVYCEYCNKAMRDVSPPDKEDYENGRIHITEGVMLLSDDVVEKRSIKGMAQSHAVNISGYYCNYLCLLNKIK